MVDNHVCVRVQPEGDERLAGVIIEEIGNANAIFGKNFADNKDACGHCGYVHF